MADRGARWRDNVPGPVFVDDACVCCQACLPEAPSLFDESDDGDHVRVVRQPEDPGDWRAARFAAEVCPVDAIGGTDPIRSGPGPDAPG